MTEVSFCKCGSFDNTFDPRKHSIVFNKVLIMSKKKQFTKTAINEILF